jgi:hypothetical protein
MPMRIKKAKEPCSAWWVRRRPSLPEINHVSLTRNLGEVMGSTCWFSSPSSIWALALRISLLRDASLLAGSNITEAIELWGVSDGNGNVWRTHVARGINFFGSSGN